VRTNISAALKPLLLGVVVLTSQAGCKSQSATLGPELEGTLTIDGKKAQGAQVLVGFSGDHDNPCQGLVPSALVDKNGWFHVPERTARLTAKEIQAIPYGTTVNYVCFRYNGRLIVDSMLLIEPTHSKSYIVDCRSPRPSIATGEDAMVCRWRVRTANNSFKPKPLRGSA
jgi:hypothetical protein